MKAAVVQADRTIKTEEKPVPTFGPNEILLKIKTIGLNPTDWKAIARNIAKPGDISGCDFVGEVVELGADVPEDQVKKGELRWGFIRGGTNPDRGGFAEYVPVEWDLSGVVPSNISAQQAASIPIPFATAVQALYLRLKVPQAPTIPSDQWILIWGGATSVGQYAIQLAKLSGLNVATTASPQRWDGLKGLGANVLVDYKVDDVVNQLKRPTDNSIEYGLDCISEGGTVQLAHHVFQPEGGHLICLLPNFGPLLRSEVQTEATMVYTALGTDQMWVNGIMPSVPEDRALFAKYAKLSTELFAANKLKPLDVEVLGTLDDVQKGLDLLESGEHTMKIVLNVS